MSDLENLLEASEEEVELAQEADDRYGTNRHCSFRLLWLPLSLSLLAVTKLFPVATHFTDLTSATEAVEVTTTATTTPITRDMTTFYMYRAQSDSDYDFENVNAANLAGLMWYLEHEVVFAQCPRHYNITRILRFKVSIKVPKTFDHNFSRFWAFDRGMCTSPACANDYAQHGFTVGCQYQDAASYPGAVWYSLPGRCPLTPLVAKKGCTALPGGNCQRPNGDADCTWSAEKAGEIQISKVEGVYNWTDFCAHHGNEYILPFWDARGDTAHMKMRMTKVLETFKKKYPNDPINLEEPLCDWRPPNFRPSLV
eukprot:symbB.v1.2.014318.t1/scaffold1020.1/size145545/6